MIKQEIFFSVIIPVYNMELYLEKCLDSIVNQTYLNLEIIIINDGSTDGSLNIIKSYAEKDLRIVVIDKLNEGIGGAYIDALNIASGHYISFVDGDDFVDIDMYQILSQHINKKNLDIIQFGYETFNEVDNNKSNVNFGEKYLEGNVKIVDYKYKNISHPGLGLKVVRKDLFEAVKLLRQNVGIDILINLQIYLNAENMLLIKDELYHILLRSNSVSRSKYDEKKTKQLVDLRELLLKISTEAENKRLISYIAPTIINETIIICRFYMQNSELVKFNQAIDEYNKYFKKNITSLILCKLPILMKALVFRCFPKLYCKMA